MKAIFTYDDEHMGKSYIVIPKIREISNALGNVVVTFDNGDKRTLDVDDARAVIGQMLETIEAFYSRS
ncbi:MAG: hypothetical protein R6T89_07965 [Candidatus Syntrophosphaera sp.]|jgi:hypothetical protein